MLHRMIELLYKMHHNLLRLKHVTRTTALPQTFNWFHGEEWQGDGEMRVNYMDLCAREGYRDVVKG